MPDLRVCRHDRVPDWWTPISAQNITCDMGDPLVAQMEHFAAVIAGLEVPLVSGGEGLKSLEVVEAVSLSSASGRAITLSEEDGIARVSHSAA